MDSTALGKTSDSAAKIHCEVFVVEITITDEPMPEGYLNSWGWHMIYGGVSREDGSN